MFWGVGAKPHLNKEQNNMAHCLTIDENTGKVITGWAVVRQSIERIFRTKAGSRILQRHFGSRLPDFIDQPYTESWVGYIYAAMADALVRFEPRFILERIEMVNDNELTGAVPKNGQLWVKLTGVFLPNGAADDMNIRYQSATQLTEDIHLWLV